MLLVLALDVVADLREEWAMWTDGYCATNECGAWAGATPEAAWMAAPEHDAAFHDSLLATIFPGAIVAAGEQQTASSDLEARRQARREVRFNPILIRFNPI